MTFTMIICYETDLARVVHEVEQAGATSYTVLSRLSGRGEGGRRLDTEAGMGQNVAVLVGCELAIASVVQKRLRALQKRLGAHAGLRAFAWEAEQWL
ncbi:MAG: P-II family nitrogen regulator [Myxococcales bacterium]